MQGKEPVKKKIVLNSPPKLQPVTRTKLTEVGFAIPISGEQERDVLYHIFHIMPQARNDHVCTACWGKPSWKLQYFLTPPAHSRHSDWEALGDGTGRDGPSLFNTPPKWPQAS